MENLSSLELILGALLAISEVLALVPGIKAHGVFQLVYGVIKGLAPKKQG